MRNKIVVFSLAATLMLLLSACGPRGTSTMATRTIAVNGTGTVYITPDIAHINIGVHTEDPEVGQAVDLNSQKTQAIISAIKSLGVEAKDIQTTNFNVTYSVQFDPETGEQTGTIYYVDNLVNITMRDLSKLSDLLDEAIRNGANNINSVSFNLADRTEAINQARQLALENAQSLANELATSAGVKLGEVQTLSYYNYEPSPYYGKGGDAAESPSSSSPINPGQMQLTVDLSIVYAIK